MLHCFVPVTPVRSNRFQPGISGNPRGRPPKNRARSDGWSNTLSGIGVEGKDKRLGGYWFPTTVSYERAQAIWRSSAIGARLVSTWPSEMLRKGWCLTSDDPEINRRVEDFAQELQLDSKLITALEYANAYGGSAILIGANDGSEDLAQPLNETRIASLDFLTVLEHRECIPAAYYDDPRAPKYNEPALYRVGQYINGTGVNGRTSGLINTLVHESRLLIFDGIRTSRQNTGENFGWGDSIFVRVEQVLADFEAACAAVGILVTDFAPNVFQMEGLLDIVAAEGQEAATLFRTRMQALALGKSVANTALVDKRDSYKRETVNVTGLADLWDRMTIQLAACGDMPVTLLMGQSPKGLGNEGESDLRFFYDRVSARQVKVLTPVIERLTRVIMAALKIPEPDTWEVKHHPLYQPTEKEAADTRAVQAATDEKYINLNVFSPDEIRASRGDGNTLTTSVSYEDPEDEDDDEIEDPTSENSTIVAVNKSGIVPQTAFNGAQITSALEIVKAVNLGQIARESGIATLTIMFPITEEQAAKMIPVFTPKVENANPPA